MEETSAQKSYGYGKKPLWLWLLIYIIIGVIVYGLIYYFVFAKKGGYNPNQTGQYQSTTKQQNTVILTQSGFSPSTVTIKAGQTITWINKSGESATVNSDPHPTHTNYPPLNLGNFQNGGSLSLTFPTTGTFGYHNHLNPSETGTIIVQ